MRRLVRTFRGWISRPVIVLLVHLIAGHAGVEPNEIARQAVQEIQNTYMSNYGDETLEMLEEILCAEFGISVEVANFGVLVARIADAQ